LRRSFPPGSGGRRREKEKEKKGKGNKSRDDSRHIGTMSKTTVYPL
jgi:hypothetical protein